MKEYIEREALKERFQKRLIWLKKDIHDEYSKGLFHGCETDMGLIDEIPTADVSPVRYGRWEPGNPICPVCGENKFKDLDADIWADWQPKFCPNCGALMEKKEDEHD